MPRNSGVAKSKMRSKSTRKPLRDVSNAKIAVKPADNLKINSEHERGQMGDDDSLDRLLLVQSDLSSLVRQIDELVVQALQLTGDKGMKEIIQFADVLSDMQASLKPWVPRLQKALLSQSTAPKNESEQSTERTVSCVPVEHEGTLFESPEKTKWESLVSPSPLVSWRAECNTEGGRQLFLLTPLPQKGAFSLKRQVMSIPTFQNIETEENTKCGNSTKISEANCLSTFVMTPRVRMSPPKSCILLEPISKSAQKKKTLGAYKATPFPPAHARNSGGGSQDSDSSGTQSSDDLAIKYPELFGIKLNDLEKKMVEEDSPDWIVSPPKTCVIMEPADEKLLENTFGNNLGKQKDAACDQQDNLFALKKVDYKGGQAIGCKIDLVESTPMIKEPISCLRTGNQPGENTLKKELWTRFEAATTHGMHFGDSILQDKTTKKGFLDRLEEALES
ncbi:Unknown protein [Striga hermonthica]|uniref:Uncharacterized protein n=1 Tax=Striga hermonthica TaxID=68872 RepID=A0A9N7NUH3_STRHE|nr:Unknown protein [Striga hermonthica]